MGPGQEGRSTGITISLSRGSRSSASSPFLASRPSTTVCWSNISGMSQARHIYATSSSVRRRLKADFVAVVERSADRMVLCNSMVTVIWPTPPGTGVM